MSPLAAGASQDASSLRRPLLPPSTAREAAATERRAPRVVVAENIGELGVAEMRRLGMDVVGAAHLSPEQLAETVRTADAVVVRGQTDVRRSFIDAATRLKIIGRAGCGVDNIDVGYAADRGIPVVNTPHANADSTAEHAIALTMNLLHRVGAGDRDLRAGNWDREKHTGTNWVGKTFAVVGSGAIGTKAAGFAKALGMKTIGSTRGERASDPNAAIQERIPDLKELFRRADVVSLHVPQTPATRNLVDRDLLREMKPTAYLVNCARGGVVDGAALLEALDQKRIAGAALDVHAVEPPFSDPVAAALVKHPETVVTQHQGGQTHEALERMGIDVADQLARFFRDEPLTSQVAAPEPSPAGRAA